MLAAYLEDIILGFIAAILATALLSALIALWMVDAMENWGE